jgi:hypothetical protein
MLDGRLRRLGGKMSYDLIFYTKRDAILDLNQVFSYLDEKLGIDDNKDRTQWFFQNEETGSYFSIDYSVSSEVDEFLFGSEYTKTGFSFNINYLRPEYFGLEAFPYVEDLIVTFNFLVYNPQGNEELAEFIKGSLFENWKKINRENSIENYKRQKLNYLELSKSNYSWSFCVNRVSLQKSLTDDIFVAGIFFNKLRNTNEVLTLSIWPECIPVVLPITDNVFIVKRAKKLFGVSEEKGLVPFEVILNTLKGSIKPTKYNGIECFILSEDDSVEAKKKFDGIKIDSSLVENIEGLAIETIVNYK